MRVLSLGAGVQSSTLLPMAIEGELQIDRAIFADTQWEPRAVYQWLEYLMPLPMVDLRTPQDRGQLDLFDDVSDGECGAFSCFGTGAD